MVARRDRRGAQAVEDAELAKALGVKVVGEA
jgi:hypothetical protein